MLTEIASQMARIIKNKQRIFLFGHWVIPTCCARRLFIEAGGIFVHSANVPANDPGNCMRMPRLSSMLEAHARTSFPYLGTTTTRRRERCCLSMLIAVPTNCPCRLAIEARKRGCDCGGGWVLSNMPRSPPGDCGRGRKLFEVVDYAVDNHGRARGCFSRNRRDRLAGLLPAQQSQVRRFGTACWTEAIFQLHQQGEDLPITASFQYARVQPITIKKLLEEWSEVNPSFTIKKYYS